MASGKFKEYFASIAEYLTYPVDAIKAMAHETINIEEDVLKNVNYSGEKWYNYYVEKYGRENVQSTFIKEIEYQPSSGIKLEPIKGKTTTVLGRYDMDTKAIFEETGNIKSLSYDGHEGGFHLLNVPDELSNAKGIDFWNDYNVPFLDEAIGRNDVIQLVTEPNNAAMYRVNTATGKLELSGFGREITYLKNHGYSYDVSLKQMIPPKGE